MNIIDLPISELIHPDYNPRQISENDFEQLKSSLTEFGAVDPAIINRHPGRENIIVGGNQRIRAAEMLGWQDFPCFVVELTEEKERELNIRLNKNTGEWDYDILANEFDIDDLLDWGFKDGELTGFDTPIVGGNTDEDDIPEVDETEPICKPGDLWQLGEHRLLCGDSTNIQHVEKLMDGEKADMVFTSPPYNANTKSCDGDIFKKRKSKKLYGERYSDNLESKDYIDFCKSVLNNCFLSTNGFVFWNVSYNSNSKYEYIKQIENQVDYLVEQICWKKSSTIPFKGCMMRDWEPIYVFSTTKESLNLKNVQSNFWEINNTNSQIKTHKACFPVGLPEKAINIKNEFKKIFDPFGGSGSTLIACEKTSRKCRMMELDPHYCDVIIKRWEDYTGKKASLINGPSKN